MIDTVSGPIVFVGRSVDGVDTGISLWLVSELLKFVGPDRLPGALPALTSREAALVPSQRGERGRSVLEVVVNLQSAGSVRLEFVDSGRDDRRLGLRIRD